MTAIDCKSCLCNLNKLVDEYNNSCNCSIDKKLVDADNSALTKEIELRHKVPKFKVGDKVSITKYRKIFSKSCFEHWSREIFFIDFRN